MGEVYRALDLRLKPDVALKVIRLRPTSISSAAASCSAARESSKGRSRWKYRVVLNIIFLVLAFLLLWRFFTTGGVEMAGMMDRMPECAHHAEAHIHWG